MRRLLLATWGHGMAGVQDAAPAHICWLKEQAGQWHIILNARTNHKATINFKMWLDEALLRGAGKAHKFAKRDFLPGQVAELGALAGGLGPEAAIPAPACRKVLEVCGAVTALLGPAALVTGSGTFATRRRAFTAAAPEPATRCCCCCSCCWR